jgi:lysophospholipase L1-like esterase
MTVRAFGDSITDGFGSSDPSLSYTGLVAANTGWSIIKLTESGSGICVFAYETVSQSIYPGDRAVVLFGYNDMRQWGTSEAGQATYTDSLMTELLWLTVPTNQKVAAYSSAVSRHGVANGGVGNWQSGSLFGCPLAHVFTADVDDYLEITLNGSAIYIGFVYRTGIGGGVFTVAVDGIEVDTRDEMAGLIGLGNYDYWPAALRIGGLPNGSHTVRVTASDLTNGNVTVSWFASNDPLPTAPMPKVYFGNCLRMNAAGYAAYPEFYGQGSDVAAAAYNVINSQVATNLISDGLKVVYVDADSYYNPNADEVQVDNAHPNDLGYSHIAQAFLEVIN